MTGPVGSTFEQRALSLTPGFVMAWLAVWSYREARFVCTSPAIGIATPGDITAAPSPGGRGSENMADKIQVETLLEVTLQSAVRLRAVQD